ncbi:hypothetical protein RIR_jg10314.t1 [Rhizophagus irregularis DAOM 181602=DAOM 197198]|nr:hypothetical protein RIR_jg10314.t1 [Rhizophagus irregularis DAOM 181602=DAOM 197198]
MKLNIMIFITRQLKTKVKTKEERNKKIFFKINKHAAVPNKIQSISNTKTTDMVAGLQATVSKSKYKDDETKLN